MEKSLAIFPKSAAFVKPAERAFHNPAFGKNFESMKLIPLYNLHFRLGVIGVAFVDNNDLSRQSQVPQHDVFPFEGRH